MTKIVFNGFYGFKNTGDDAFVEVASWGNQYYWNNNQKPFFIGEDLPLTQAPIKEIYNADSNKVSQKLGVFNKLLNSNYFITAGGSYFSEVRPLGNLVCANKASLLNNKLIQGAIGVSIGPFESSKDEKRVQEYLKKLKFLTLRDSKSYEYASSINLKCKPIKAFDLAALLPFCYKGLINEKTSTQKRIIGVSVCNYERYHGGNLQNEVNRNNFIREVLIQLVKNKNNHFKFFIFNGHNIIGDAPLTQEMISVIPEEQCEIIPYNKKTIDTWQNIKSCDFMLSTRLHASIFACYADVPFMLVEYHRKCSDFLEDVGYDDSLRVYDAQKSPNVVAENIEEILEGNYIYPTHKEDTIARAKLNFTKVHL